MAALELAAAFSLYPPLSLLLLKNEFIKIRAFMEDKDIEEIISKSAEGIKIKDFSERWPNILRRRNAAQQYEVLEELHVLPSPENYK